MNAYRAKLLALADEFDLGGEGSGNFGHSGRPGEIGGSGPSTEAQSIDAPAGRDPNPAPADNSLQVPIVGALGEERPTPIVAKDLAEAVELILQGKVVELPDVGSVHTVLSKLADIAKDAEAKEEKAPDYDLCNVSVAGTNLFCGSFVRTEEFPNGIPRLDMPQLMGKPRPGSDADDLPKNERGNVDAVAHFLTHLQDQGIEVGKVEPVPASSLKASQVQLVGPTVAAMMLNTKFEPGDEPIIVSSDNYVLDGHHRWAAVVGRDAKDGVLGQSTMNVVRVDAPISELLHRANVWTKEFGIKPKAGTKKKTALAMIFGGDMQMIEAPPAASMDFGGPVTNVITALTSLTDVLRSLGGAGSGNFGHAGRKGEVGGSGKGVAFPTPLTKSTTDGDVTFAHNEPVTFPFLHNTEKSPDMGARFGQDIEPAGRYVIVQEIDDPPSKWEAGTLTFQRPLVIDAGPDYGPTGWKARLSDAYGGKTGRALSRAIIADGHDGIVTIDTKYHDIGEVVDLTGFNAKHLGGEGSGNYGHSGRKGEVGGSGKSAHAAVHAKLATLPRAANWRDTRFILPDGSRVTGEGEHETIANKQGTTLDEVLHAGVIRLQQNFNLAPIAQVGGPISHAQATGIIDAAAHAEDVDAEFQVELIEPKEAVTGRFAKILDVKVFTPSRATAEGVRRWINGHYDGTIERKIAASRFLMEGNEHSGNYGHKGRPGEVGGSGPGSRLSPIGDEHTDSGAAPVGTPFRVMRIGSATGGDTLTSQNAGNAEAVDDLYHSSLDDDGPFIGDTVHVYEVILEEPTEGYERFNKRVASPLPGVPVPPAGTVGRHRRDNELLYSFPPDGKFTAKRIASAPTDKMFRQYGSAAERAAALRDNIAALIDRQKHLSFLIDLDDREYVRDEQGRFAETGGSGTSGPSTWRDDDRAIADRAKAIAADVAAKLATPTPRTSEQVQARLQEIERTMHEMYKREYDALEKEGDKAKINAFHDRTTALIQEREALRSEDPTGGASQAKRRPSTDPPELVARRGAAAAAWLLTGTDNDESDAGLGHLREIRSAAIRLRNNPSTATKDSDAQVLLDAAEPTTVPLFRGTSTLYFDKAGGRNDRTLDDHLAKVLAKVAPGTVHDLTMTSFTEDRGVASHFEGAHDRRSSGPHQDMIITLKPGGKSVDMAKHALAALNVKDPVSGADTHGVAEREKEHLPVGHARVTTVRVEELSPTSSGKPRRRVHVEMEPVDG